MAIAVVADSERGQHERQIPRPLLQLVGRLVATRLPLELRAFRSQTVIHFLIPGYVPTRLSFLRV
jgi:hypothetical protein